MIQKQSEDLDKDHEMKEWGLFQRRGDAERKERSVIFGEDVGGRAKVTTDDERVLRRD